MNDCTLAFILAIVVVRMDVICCQLIYFSSVIERTWWPRLVRLIGLLVSVALPFHLSVDRERVASLWLLVCCV